jgi:hypothetical protein
MSVRLREVRELTGQKVTFAPRSMANQIDMYDLVVIGTGEAEQQIRRITRIRTLLIRSLSRLVRPRSGQDVSRVTR